MLAFRIGRILTAAGSRDQRYQRAAAVLREAPASVERAEQVRLVADRLELTQDLEAALMRPRRDAERAGAAGRPAPAENALGAG